MTKKSTQNYQHPQQILLIQEVLKDLKQQNYIKLKQLKTLIKSQLSCDFLKYHVIVITGSLARLDAFIYSDIDILFIARKKNYTHQIDSQKNWQTNIANLISIAWQQGFRLAQRFCYIEEIFELCKQDVHFATQLLEANYLLGQQSLNWQMHHQFKKYLNQYRHDFWQLKVQEIQKRHAKRPLYALQPNCKEDAGGLRDIHYLYWLSRLCGFAPKPILWRRHLKLKSLELKRLRKQQRYLSYIRYQLQLYCKKNNNFLYFENQIYLAQQLQFNDTVAYANNHDKQKYLQQMMYHYFRSTRVIWQSQHYIGYLLQQNYQEKYSAYFETKTKLILNNQTIKNITIDIYLLSHHPNTFNPHIERQFFLWQQKQKNLHKPLNQAIFIHALQRACWQGYTYEWFDFLAKSSFLGHYLSAFRRITGKMQYDLFHIYTIDQHLLQVILHLQNFQNKTYTKQLLQVNSGADFVCYQILQNKQLNWLIFLAAFFHDIGKASQQDHSIVGKQLMLNFCQQHQLSSCIEKLLTWLVEFHLIFSQLAQKQNIYDKDVIFQFCKHIKASSQSNILFGAVDYLQCLFVLTIADIKGSNPNAWNAWKESVFLQAYNTCLAHINLKNFEQVQNTSDNGTMVEQSDLIKSCTLNASKANILCTQQFNNGFYELSIKCPNNLYVFSYVCGFCAQYLINIHDAKLSLNKCISKQAKNRQHKQLSMLLILEKKLSYIQLQSLVQHLHTQNIQSNLHLKKRPSSLLRYFTHPIYVNLVMIELNMYRLDIHANDSLGLLHQVAFILAKHQLFIESAKINTLGERVEDVFIISATQPIYQQNLLDELNELLQNMQML